MPKRVLLIANKWYECEPLMSVLVNDNARPALQLGWPVLISYPHQRPNQNNLPQENVNPTARAVFHLTNVDVEVWCISDLMEDLPDQAKFQSSSKVKMNRLPRIFQGTEPSLVIAFGTANYPSAATFNGSVVCGTRAFIYNAHPTDNVNPDSNWQDATQCGTVLESRLESQVFDAITLIETSPKPSVLDRFIVPAINPIAYGQFIARHDLVALSDANVTDPTEYIKTDAATLQAFTASNNILQAASIETTHGLIRLQSDAPFLFISGIANRIGHFGDEVIPRMYAQSTVAAHNAGIAAAWMLPQIDELLAD